MLFKEILDQKFENLEPIFDTLFNLVLKNQAHSGDLLLVRENGFLSEASDPNDSDKIKLFYNIGEGLDFHCETTCHNYIKNYISETLNMKYEDYKQLHIYTEERSNEIDRILGEEVMSIQTEMMIYLKIWEGENFLKKMYQLSRLIDGRAYDWHLSIRFGKRGPSGSLEKHEILKEIKKSFKTHIPNLFDSFSYCHRPQLRNAIAHSQYAMLGRTILLNNHIEGKSGHQHDVSFDEWVQIFHESLILFTLYEMLLKRIRQYYYDLTKPFRLKKEVRVTRLYPMPATFPIVLYSRDVFQDWSPYPNT